MDLNKATDARSVLRKSPIGIWETFQHASTAITTWLPEGGSLPEASWLQRHRAIVVVLWLHAIGIASFGIAAGYPLTHSLAEGGMVAMTAALAGWGRGSRAMRAGIATFGLVLSSSLLVHISGGYVEFHFHFFVMVIVVSLYEDWVPFLLAIAFVILEHGVVGVLIPTAVYNHPDAWEHPWKWAAIHGAFVLAASGASIVGWRLNEIVRSRYHLILDSAGDGIYGLDRRGRITFANATAARLLGRIPTELIGQPEDTVLRYLSAAGESPEENGSPALTTLATGMPQKSSGKALRRKDGTTFHGDFVSAPVRERGELVGVVVAFQDVTERSRAEQALRESEERLRQIVNMALDAVIVTDDQGQITEWNGQAQTMFGWSRDQAIGRSPIDLIVPKRLRQEHTHLAAEFFAVRDDLELNRRIELEVVTRDGRELSVEMAITGVRTAKGQTFSVFVRDLTDRKLAEEQAAQMAHTDKLRALGQMASGIAHDLNQSLGIVSGYSDLARRMLNDPTPDLDGATRMMDAVALAATDGGETVSRLLHFARRDEGAPAAIIDVHYLLSEVVNLTAPRWRDLTRAEGRPITLRLDLAPTTTIEGQPTELRQALTNLIFNAVDAMPNGGALTVSARQWEDRVEIAVVDTGIGMTRKVQERLFEPFFSTKGERGSGLGLAQVFGIVERHRATIDVTSVINQGTTFLLSFPATSVRTVERSPVLIDPSTPPIREVVAIGKIVRIRRVLAVDDNDVLRQLVVHTLTREGCEVITAASGEEALLRLRERSFDVVVSDLGLGDGMDGWELAARVREEWTGVRFLLATGWKPDLDPAQVRARGVDGILGKPYRIADLEAALAVLT